MKYSVGTLIVVGLVQSKLFPLFYLLEMSYETCVSILYIGGSFPPS